ncbi:aldose 1-epimerase [Streptomyces sulfonofaciens]|uniref:Aldose 1-epimerase n=1 Tax=Streptomyces sulfonofaciens TaxID=68272 RepID=A0A919GGZ2_9ACTN|nr:aldose epimerase family protein [Streptomyces sulfonofaciens]GHH84257.1 aldose 1-epimerase [Streptomyces sulfonofaciens]
MGTEPFGALPDGTPVHRWTLERAGVRVRVLTYGGIVQSVRTPDREGHGAEVALGFDDLDGYLEHTSPYFGALVGRFANRIGQARFPLDERIYHLPANEGPNLLHGGDGGFDKRVWDAAPVPHGVRLTRVSPHGEEGFPGRLEVSVTYALDEAGALAIDYSAVTDAPTVVNLTNHAYWNLSGADSGTATGHELRIAASRITALAAGKIPTGELAPVDGTRFDFREPRKTGPGHDQNYALDKGVTSVAEPVAELYDPASGRVLTVATTEPGLQLYTGDYIDHGPYGPCAGTALETQHFPDAPNRPEFPSTVLRPGAVFTSRTVYGFSAR